MLSIVFNCEINLQIKHTTFIFGYKNNTNVINLVRVKKRKENWQIVKSDKDGWKGGRLITFSSF